MTTAGMDGNERFSLVKPDLATLDGKTATGSGPVLLQARGVKFSMHSGVPLFFDVSFHVEPGEFVALTGPSRSGKTALLHSLAGLKKPTDGEISIDGVSLYANPKAFRSAVGFVPAEYALQQHLTVTETLFDASRLRLPRSASHKDRQKRVQTLLETLGLAQVADTKVGWLNKADKRKLGIAIELSGYPGLLLLDQAADGLAPFEEMQITTLLRGLSQQGITIIQVNQHSQGIQLSDKVIFLAPGGSLAWFGPVDQAYAYFGGFHPEAKSKDAFGFEEALEVLANPQLGNGSEWSKRFKAHPAYPKYVDDPLNNRYPDLQLESQPLLRLRSIAQEKSPPEMIPRANAAQELVLLVQRNSRLLWRGKAWPWMIAIPPLAACADFFLSSPKMLDPQLGDPARPPLVFGVLVFLDLLVSALLFHNEIFKERTIYQHERRINPSSFPYILSKVWLVVLFAIYQGAIWTVTHFAASGMAGGLQVLPAYGITFTLVAVVGGLLGLVASSLSRTAGMHTVWALSLTVPQLLFSGAIIPLAQANVPVAIFSAINPSRYAFEALVTASGYGVSVANDPCWQLPADKRSALTDFQKQGCICMGVNLFSLCRFPGIRNFYSFVIEQPMPASPQASSAIDNIPAQPLPKPGETLDQFSAQMDTYAAQMETYLGNYISYLSALQQYPDILANWQRMRSLIIGNAEGVIREAIDNYGQAFNVNLASHWSIMLAMILGLIILLSIIPQGKGVAFI
jgi:ABC-type multidrug transport system ATPase subunit